MKNKCWIASSFQGQIPKAGETLPYVPIHFNIQLGYINLLRCIKSHSVAEQNPKRSIKQFRDISVVIYRTLLLHPFLQTVMRQRNNRRIFFIRLTSIISFHTANK